MLRHRISIPHIMQRIMQAIIVKAQEMADILIVHNFLVVMANI